MENTEAILENENNSNLESESNIRQQLANQIASAEIEREENVTEPQIQNTSSNGGSDTAHFDPSTKDEEHNRNKSEEVVADSEENKESRDLTDSKLQGDDESNTVMTEDAENVTEIKSTIDNDSNERSMSEVDGKELVTGKDGDLLAESSEKDDNGQQCSLGPPELTNEAENESLSRFSPLGDNDIAPKLLPNKSPPLYSKTENSNISNFFPPVLSDNDIVSDAELAFVNDGNVSNERKGMDSVLSEGDSGDITVSQEEEDNLLCEESKPSLEDSELKSNEVETMQQDLCSSDPSAELGPESFDAPKNLENAVSSPKMDLVDPKNEQNVSKNGAGFPDHSVSQPMEVDQAELNTPPIENHTLDNNESVLVEDDVERGNDNLTSQYEEEMNTHDHSEEIEENILTDVANCEGTKGEVVEKTKEGEMEKLKDSDRNTEEHNDDDESDEIKKSDDCQSIEINVAGQSREKDVVEDKVFDKIDQVSEMNVDESEGMEDECLETEVHINETNKLGSDANIERENVGDMEDVIKEGGKDNDLNEVLGGQNHSSEKTTGVSSEKGELPDETGGSDIIDEDVSEKRKDLADEGNVSSVNTEKDEGAGNEKLNVEDQEENPKEVSESKEIFEASQDADPSILAINKKDELALDVSLSNKEKESAESSEPMQTNDALSKEGEKSTENVLPDKETEYSESSASIEPMHIDDEMSLKGEKLSDGSKDVLSNKQEESSESSLLNIKPMQTDDSLSKEGSQISTPDNNLSNKEKMTFESSMSDSAVSNKGNKSEDHSNDVLPVEDIKQETDSDPVSCESSTVSQDVSAISKQLKKEVLNDTTNEDDEDDVVILSDDDDDVANVSVKQEVSDGKERMSIVQNTFPKGSEQDAKKSSSSAKNTNETSGKSEKVAKVKIQTCIVCQKVTKCKFNIVRGGDTKQLCDDVCFKKFRKTPSRYLIKPAALSAAQVQPKTTASSPMNPILSTMKLTSSSTIPTTTPSTSIPPRAVPESTYKTCCICQVLNLQSPHTFCNWKGFDFCGETCLGKFQGTLNTKCSFCFNMIPTNMRFAYCVNVGGVMKSFCRRVCMTDFMKLLKTCACCKQSMWSITPILAKVGSEKKAKEFCSQACVKKLDEQFKDIEIIHVEHGKETSVACSVCRNKANGIKHNVRFQSKTFNLCSSICLSAFQYTNNINLTKCNGCGNMGTSVQMAAHTIQFEGETWRFCSDMCVEKFRTEKKKSVNCSWCQKSRENFDMIERVDEKNKFLMFCTLNCLSLFRVNLQAKSNQAVKCDQCKKVVPAQYHLTMSDASVRNFCSYTCVMLFQTQFTNRIAPPLPLPSESPSKSLATGQLQNVKPNVQSQLKPQQQQQPIIAPPPHSHGTRNRNRNKSKLKTTQAMADLTVTTSSTSSSPLVIASVRSLAADEAPPPPQTIKISSPNLKPSQIKELQEKTAALVIHNLEKKNTILAGNGQKQIVTDKPLPPLMKNKSIQCRPMCQTKATACRPHSQVKDTQTDKNMGKPVIVPVPVPIYIPMPTVMYSVPTPVPIPIPVPIPVPIFIPTTRKSARGIIKMIRDMREKMPADPLEAELLMMAEAVASEGRPPCDSDSDTDGYGDLPDDDDLDDTEPVPEIANPKEVKAGKEEDMIQMALRMAEEMTGPMEDLETSVQPVAVNNMQAKSGQLQQSDMQNFRQVDDPDYIPQRGRGRGAKRSSRGRPPSTNNRAKRQRMDRYIESDQEEPPRPPVVIQEHMNQPDKDYRLKYTYGVNAWKHWVVGKNTELEKTMKKNARIRLLPLDVLKCTMDELHFSLCQFITEVRKPNGESYSPDSVYYLCLGIQQYLYENGRIDNIFTDLYFKRYTDALHDVIKTLQPKVNSQGQMLCRIEEEHLWESKQLGAHSPYVLMNTLIYFHTKHFILKNAADHMSLSFAQILKHWKKGVPTKGAPNSTTAGKNASLRYYCLANKKQDFAARKGKEGPGVPVYEVTENIDNPLRCPVKLYEFFLSKCPESIKNRNDIFYPVPERSCVPDSPVWYSTQAIEHHTMDKMLTRILLVREIQEAHLHAQPTYVKM